MPKLLYIKLSLKVLLKTPLKNVDLSKTDIIEKDDEVEMKFWAEYIRYLYNKDNAQENESVSSKSKLLDFKSFIGENVWRTLEIE